MHSKKSAIESKGGKRKSSDIEKSQTNPDEKEESFGKLSMIDLTESKRLSKNILAMKFMQRKAEAELRERLRREQEEVAIKARWSTENETNNLNSNELNFSKKLMWEEVSIINMLKNPVTRRSYGGFNTTFEKSVPPPFKKQKL